MESLVEKQPKRKFSDRNLKEGENPSNCMYANVRILKEVENPVVSSVRILKEVKNPDVLFVRILNEVENSFLSFRMYVWMFRL